MARAPYQVLVFPYRIGADGQPQYALFKRFDLGVWQAIAGGGEDKETPEQAARREASEEAGIPADADLLRLDSTASIPVIYFPEHHLWGTDVHVIPEYSFGIEVKEGTIRLSDEHSECEWLDYGTAHARLRWDSNRTALWELHRRLSAKGTA
jgi:dATP pyrophosphohydrolase